MDPAQEIELHAKRFHKPIDDLVDRGDSAIQQYYKGTTVFVTGGSGFLGKQLIEKILRSCAIKKIYLLTRSKKGKTIQERVNQMLKEPIFDRLREKQPHFANKIEPIEGDVAAIRLGLHDKDWTLLANEVEIIFHEAATIRFDEPLAKAIFINVRGTREALTLAKQCSKLKKFIHVSTIFSHATIDTIGSKIDEQFYPSPMSPKTIIALAEQIDQRQLDSITINLIKGWPNTYTFTKAVAEELIRSSAGNLPVCIVRPSIVIPAYYEPNPGWLDTHTVIGPSGVYLGSALGIIRVFLTDVNSNTAMAPVDFVNNITIAAAWDSTERQKIGETEIPIYHINRHFRYGLIGETMRKYRQKGNFPQAVWYAETYETTSKLLYFVLSWFYHYIPAYCIDFLCKIFRIKLPKEMPSFVGIYRMIDKLAGIYNYFLFNHWNFTDNNIRAMIGRMSDADNMIFNCDLSNIDLVNYIMVWSIGLRRYILKENLTGTAVANKRQKIFYVLRYFALALYVYSLWYVVSSVLMILKYLLSCFFK